MGVHSPSGKIPETDGFSYQFTTTNHPVQGILQCARYAVGVLGAGDHHGGGSVHLCTKAPHGRWTRVHIQVRIEVGKTIQHVTEVKVGAWKRYASSKPQYSGVKRFGAQTSGNCENPHVYRMTHRAAPILEGGRNSPSARSPVQLLIDAPTACSFPAHPPLPAPPLRRSMLCSCDSGFKVLHPERSWNYFRSGVMLGE